MSNSGSVSFSHLTGVNMFKRHIYEFSKTSQNWRFLKMHKNSTSRENSNV